MHMQRKTRSGTARRRSSFTWSVAFLTFLPVAHTLQAEPIEVASPGNVLKVIFEVQDGSPTYRVSRLGRPVINTSKLGFLLRGAHSLDRESTCPAYPTAQRAASDFL